MFENDLKKVFNIYQNCLINEGKIDLAKIGTNRDKTFFENSHHCDSRHGIVIKVIRVFSFSF